MKKDILTRPFPAELVKQRQGQGGRTLNYIETHAVIERLNTACDAWDFTVEKYEVLEDEVVVLGKLVVEGSITKAAFGGSSITRDRDGRVVSMADALKAAASDALKKSASLLGVGLELYGAGPSGETRHTVRRIAGAEKAGASASPNDRLTARQLSAIQTVARKQSIGRDHLAHLLDERFEKTELAHLSRHEASSLLSELTGANGVHR